MRRDGSDMTKLELRLAVLFRGAQPQTRAAMAERALVRTIAEWAPGAGVALDLQTSRDGAAVRVRMRPLGDPPSGWQRDARHSLEPIGVLTATRVVSSAPREPVVLAELERDPARSRLDLEEVDSTDGVQRAAEQAARISTVAWPEAVHDAAGDVLGALRGVPGAFVRVLLAAPAEMERAMLHDELAASWNRFAAMSRDAYMRSALRPVAQRPIDAAPRRTATSVRLGTAITAEGGARR